VSVTRRPDPLLCRAAHQPRGCAASYWPLPFQRAILQKILQPQNPLRILYPPAFLRHLPPGVVAVLAVAHPRASFTRCTVLAPLPVIFAVFLTL